MTKEEEKKYDTVVEHSVATEAELDFVKSVVKLLMVSSMYALATTHPKSGEEEEGLHIAD